MELVDFFQVILRWKWLILLVVVLVTALGTVSAIRDDSSYRAESTVMAGLDQITSSSVGGINIIQNGERLGATYSEVITSQPVLLSALDRAGLSWSVSTLQPMVSITTIKNTPVMKISVVDSDPQRVKTLANAVASSFIDYVKDVSAQSVVDMREILDTELVSVEQDLVKERQAPVKDEARIIALQDRRDGVIKEYNSLIAAEIRTGDVQIVNEADSYQVIGTQVIQKSLIGFIGGLIVAVVAAFMADALRRAAGYAN